MTPQLYIFGGESLSSQALARCPRRFLISINQRGIKFFWLEEYQRNTLEVFGTKIFSTKKKQKIDSNTLGQNQLHIALSYFEYILWTGIRSHKNWQSVTIPSTKMSHTLHTTENCKTESLHNKLYLNFYKLMSKSAFAKTMESLQRRLVVEIVNTIIQLLAQTKEMWMKTNQRFNNVLAAITFIPLKICWNEPTVVGATILDLPKRHKYWLHYKHMKANFKTLALCSDTNFLSYEIESEGLYEDLKSNDAI